MGSLGWLNINFSVESVRDDALLLIKNSIFLALAALIAIILILARLLKPNLRAIGEATEFAKSLHFVHGQQTNIYHGSSEIEALNHALNETSKKLYTQEEEINNTNSLLTNVLNASSEVSIIATNTEGVITVFNSGAERLLGYTADEVINKQSPAPFHVPAEVQTRAQELSDSLGYPVSGFRTFVVVAEQQGSEQREWTYVRKNGESVSVSLVITTMRSNSGEITGYLGIAQDITERKRIDLMKSEFVSTVSHELRTPLTAIAGALGLIAGGALGALPDKIKLMLDIAHKNSHRLTFLINDLLDMEKLVAGKMHFDMKLQKIMPMIEQSIESNRTYGVERGINFILHNTVNDDTEVYVDGQRLLQVLSNLLSNAIKYSPDQGTVAVSVTPEDHSVRVTVTDHGPGIPAKFRSRIFGKFSQADSSDTRQKGGSGLGLAITRELVQRMGGKIDFDSVEGEGASFYFDLPLMQTTTNALPSAAIRADSDIPRILLVEDEPDIANLLSLLLSREGYTVDIALSGAMALDALKRTRYNAMTLDLMLPDISGLEIIRKVRSQAETADIPIIVISAKMEEGKLAINGDFAGIDWLTKPINEAHLLSSMKKHLIGDSARQQKVLHVEDDKDLHLVICAMAGDQFEFVLATTLRDARDKIKNFQYDMVILDIGLSDGSGWNLLPDIRTHQQHARIVILSGDETSPDDARRVEAVLLKSQISPAELLAALNSRLGASSKG